MARSRLRIADPEMVRRLPLFLSFQQVLQKPATQEFATTSAAGFGSTATGLGS
jgi:hypothetical protein